MKRGFAKPVDLFQPSLLRSGPTTKIAVFDISTDWFICSGNTDAVHWDIASLRIIDVIELLSVSIIYSRFDNEFVVALYDGMVVTYDTRTLEAMSELKLLYIYRSAPLRIGRNLNQRYIAFENGPCIFFEGDGHDDSSNIWCGKLQESRHYVNISKSDEILL